MKQAAIFFLTLFLAFIATPTTVAIIEKDCDTSAFYTVTEEEEHKNDTKIVTYIISSKAPDFINRSASARILYENLSRHNSIAGVIFLPPPEV